MTVDLNHESSPQGAALDVLEAALDAVDRILRIAHPALNPHDPRHDRLPGAAAHVWVAESLVDLAEVMRRAIAQYRLASRHHDSSDRELF